MARKKKSETVVLKTHIQPESDPNAPKSLDEVLDRMEEPAQLCLTEIELLKLKLFESEARRCSLEASLKFTAKQETTAPCSPPANPNCTPISVSA